MGYISNFLIDNSKVTCIIFMRSQIIYEQPGVVLRPLPFYDLIEEIIRPAGLISDGNVGQHLESQIDFRLSPDQADMLAMAAGERQILIRFCYLDTTSEQDDNFPPDINIKVNQIQLQLPPATSNPNKPNMPPKRPGQHVDITKYCKFCPFVTNSIVASWSVDPTDPKRSYAITVITAEKRETSTLLQRIRDRGSMDHELTKKLILDSDNEVSTMNLQTSLVCPLGKMRMINPCKSTTCQHIPCFDALVYLQMNEKKPTWICPVCYKPAYFQDLRIDGYFMDVLVNTPLTVTEVSLDLDGSWNPVMKVEQPVSATNANNINNNHNQPEIIVISDEE